MIKRDIKRISKDFASLLDAIKRASNSYYEEPFEDPDYPVKENPLDEIKGAIQEVWGELKTSVNYLKDSAYAVSQSLSHVALIPRTEAMNTGISSAINSLVNFRAGSTLRLTTSHQLKLLDRVIESYGAFLSQTASSCRQSISLISPGVSQSLNQDVPSIPLLHGKGLQDPYQTIIVYDQTVMNEAARIKTQIASTRSLLDRLRVLSINNSSAYQFRQALNSQNSSLYLSGVMDILLDLYTRFGGSELRVSSPSLANVLGALDGSLFALQSSYQEILDSLFMNLSDEESISVDLLGNASFVSGLAGWCDSVDAEVQVVSSISGLIQATARDVSLSTLGQIQKMQALKARATSVLSQRISTGNLIDERLDSLEYQASYSGSLLAAIYELLEELEVGILPPPDEEEEREDEGFDPREVELELISSVLDSIKELKNGFNISACLFSDDSQPKTLSAKAARKCLLKGIKKGSIKPKDLSRLHALIVETTSSLSEPS